MNLNDIIHSAQGGQGLQNLANEFGLSPDQGTQRVRPGEKVVLLGTSGKSP